jgi:hypothetical protein
MATINPFYRFEDAPEVPSIGEGAVRVSEILNNCYFDILGTVFTGQLITAAYQSIKATVDYYNSTFDTNFLIKKKTTPQIVAGVHLVEYLVYDVGLKSLYPMSGVNIVLEVNTDTVSGQFVGCFGPVPDDYDYGTPLYDGEKAAYNALTINYDTGAAVFPAWYSFDATTGVATSYIARLKDCKYDADLGRVVRVPIDTKPRGSAIKKSGSPQTEEGKYIEALFNQLIQAAVNGASYNDLSIIRNSFVPPSGYVLSYFFEVSPVERQQINIYKPSGEGYALIIRDDNGILFQRFYAPLVTNLYDIIDANSGGTALPYAPDNGITYGGVWYDFEQYQFADACAIPVESYPMPIMSGDMLRFNIEPDSANILTDNTVSIGLFDEQFNFVQKIGTAERGTHNCCNAYQAGFARTLSQWNDIIDIWNGYVDDPATHKIGVVWLDTNNPTFKREFWYDLTATVSYLDLTTIFEGFTDAQNIFEVTTVVDPIIGTIISLAYTPVGYACTTSEGLLCYIQLSEIPTFLIQGWEMQITGGFEVSNNTQHYSNVTIPVVKSGCYRFGVYQFGYDFDGMQTSWSQQGGSVGLNLCVAILDGSGTVQWLITIKKDLANWAALVEWLQANVPFGVFEIEQPSLYSTYTVYPYINMVNWTMEIGTYDFSTGAFTVIYNADEQSGTGGLYNQNINEIYSFSNLLNLDNSDCFSTILEFWGEEGSIAQGFEYYNNWSQKVRLGINGGGKKPILTESVYRQSNGVHKRPQNKQDLSVDLHTDFLDFEAQCAVVDATRHPYFVWNGQSLFVNGEIEVATVQDFTTQSSFEDLAQVKFSALIQGFQPKNSTCINC